MSFSMDALNRASRTMSSAFAANGDIMARSMERISTGSRINRASDDFTGFSKLADLAVEQRSFQDNSNALKQNSAELQQVLDVANQMMDDLQNMETALANGDTDLAAGYGESVEQALTLTDSGGTNTLINPLLVTNLGITTADGTALAATLITDYVDGAGDDLGDVTDASNATVVGAAISDLETYIKEVESVKATVDSQQTLADIMASNSEAVASAITEVDEAAEMAKYIDADIRQQAAISMFSQANLSRRNLSNLYT